MTTWRIRHEGSPRSVDDLTFEQVLEGLRDGLWEPTDEVMGPDDRDWVAIESHPLLEEVALDMEPRPARHFDEGTHLDMTALIDVCLVLLIFFILTTSYAALQKRLEAPGVSDKKVGVPVITKKDIDTQMIHVRAKLEGGEPVVYVEKDAVAMEDLVTVLRSYARKTARTTVLLEHDGKVKHSVVVQIIDKTKGAGLDRVLELVPR